MLRIVVPAGEIFDEATNTFYSTNEFVLELEHSLVSLSKWESKWCKPFLDKKEKTQEETIDYVRQMTLNDNVPSSVYLCLTNENLNDILNYINAPMTATWFSEDKTGRTSRETVTSELIYYWMIALNIPMECQHWHLTRLMTLIKVCNIKNTPPKSMSKRELMNRNSALNAARRKQFNTRG